MSCFRCDHDIGAFEKYLSIKGIILCEECAEPRYGVDEGATCYMCGKALDVDDDEVVDICDGEFLCAECARDEMEEYDPEGDAADDWYNWTRDELRGY